MIEKLASLVVDVLFSSDAELAQQKVLVFHERYRLLTEMLQVLLDTNPVVGDRLALIGEGNEDGAPQEQLEVLFPLPDEVVLQVIVCLARLV